MKKYIIGFILAAILVAVALWWFKFKNEPTLADLQKQYVSAKTETEKNKIVDRLEQYYLNLAVPDSLRQRVDRDVAAQVDTTKIDLAGFTPDTNVYRLEGQLQSLLYTGAVARARSEEQAFQAVMGQARRFAQTVDMGTQNHYWVPFVETVDRFTPEQAITWLKAKRTERLVWYFNNMGKVMEAERSASLGLELLQHVKDDRLWLDIMQRLQYLLYWHRSMYDLSLALAQKALPLADKIKYHLRATGLRRDKAETLALMGQNQAALAYYDTIFWNAAKFKQINGMQLYANQSIVQKAEMHRELGDYEKAGQACREAEKMNLDPKAMTRLYIAKFNLFLETAHYEQAEIEIRKALALAESQGDHDNHIRCLINLGALFYQLTDYDSALACYRQAQLLCTDASTNLNTHLNVLSHLAQLFAIKNDSIEVEKISKEAQVLLKTVYTPYMEAFLLSTIGNWYQLAKKHMAAIPYHHQADSIFYHNDLLHFSVAKKVDLLDCLIALSRFREAKALLAEVTALAKKINDIDALIHLYDQTAQIHYREGNIAQAVEYSNRLSDEISTLSARFNNANLLMAYRQRMYDFLKHAALYEMAQQHQEVALAKLDKAKAYALKNRLLDQMGNFRQEADAIDFDLALIKKRLQPKQLLLDYMMTPDTLYAFMLDQDGLQLLRKKIATEALRRTANDYRDSINQTARIFQHYDAQLAKANYAGTAVLGQQLYQDLLGWPELARRLQDTELLYIVPDEFLYEIPFSTLMSSRSDPATFLVNRTAVLTLPSMSLLADKSLANAALNQPQTMKVLISADRHFPGTEQFVAKVKALFPLAEELVVPDSAFNKEVVLAQLQKNYQVYIFLGHGQANAQYPDRGYMELSVKTSKAPAAKTMPMSVADLKTVNWLGAELVMLIGCETASGKLYRGTGISGLQQELLALGARNVLGNLWEVDATHAIAQAQDFLMTWATSWDLLRALQESQRKTMQALQEHRYYKQPHPYFWGSAVLLTTIAQ